MPTTDTLLAGMLPLLAGAILAAEPRDLALDQAQLPRGAVLQPTAACGPALLKTVAPEQSLAWVMPADLAPGFYRLEFTGSSAILPFIDSQSRELEPYRIFVGPPPQRDSAGGAVTTALPPPVAIRFQSFTYPDPAAPDTVLADLPHPHFTSRGSVVRRRLSDRPLALAPGVRLTVQLRYGGIVMAGPIRLVPLAAGIDLVLAGTDPRHTFDERTPPRFQADLSAFGAAWNGTLEVAWHDLWDGTVVRERRPLHLDPGTPVRLTLDRPVQTGAYTLEAALVDGEGRLATRLIRHFTCSPRLDAADLPDSWPFGHHYYPGDPDLPAIGIKWMRIFRSWGRDLEAERGRFTWETLDDCVQQCRKQGMRALYVLEGTPRWANAEAGPETHGGRVPDDCADLERFLAAFWARYAPGGALDVVRAIEVWNEPNCQVGPRFTHADYARLGAVIRRATRAHAPDARVVGICESGGLHMDFVEKVLDAGVGRELDAASLHIYENDVPFGPLSIESKIRLMRAALDRRGLALPLWDTESGISFERRQEVAPYSQEELNRLAEAEPAFAAACPFKIGTRWRRAAEATAAAWLVRSQVQKLALGVEKVFAYRWIAGTYSWIHDAVEGGNPKPKLAIPVQAVLGGMWLRYGGRCAGPVALDAPAGPCQVVAYRFSGRDGSLVVAFAQPRAVTSGTSDEVADGLRRGRLDPEMDRMAKSRLNPWLRTEPLPPVRFTLRTGAARVRVSDLLGRGQAEHPVHAGAVGLEVGDAPIYIVEPAAP